MTLGVLGDRKSKTYFLYSCELMPLTVMPLERINHQITLEGYTHHRQTVYQRTYQLGLVFHYRGNAAMAYKYLQWVVEHAENDGYIQAAKSLLKKLPPQ